MCVYFFIFIFIYCVLRPLWCQLKGQQPRTAVNDMRPLYLPDIRLVCEDFRGRLTPVRELGLRGKPCTPNSWATVVQGCSQGYASFGRSLVQLILDVSTFHSLLTQGLVRGLRRAQGLLSSKVGR